jgi:hypothetical protein
MLMRKWLAAAAIALLGAVAVAHPDIAAFVGTWNGTWEGGGAGRFDLTIERGSDGKPAGASRSAPNRATTPRSSKS